MKCVASESWATMQPDMFVLKTDTGLEASGTLQIIVACFRMPAVTDSVAVAREGGWQASRKNAVSVPC